MDGWILIGPEWLFNLQVENSKESQYPLTIQNATWFSFAVISQIALTLTIHFSIIKCIIRIYLVAKGCETFSIPSQIFSSMPPSRHFFFKDITLWTFYSWKVLNADSLSPTTTNVFTLLLSRDFYLWLYLYTFLYMTALLKLTHCSLT